MDKRNHNIYIYLLLTIIFLIGLFIRFYRLNNNLPPLYADETTGHYQILGKINSDYGNIFKNIYNQIFFRTFSFVWIFGLNPLGVRAASAIYGALVIISFFFVFNQIKILRKGNKIVPLIASTIIAFSPWSINTSRLGHTHVSIILIILSLHLYLYLRSKNVYQALISIIPLVVGFLYYPSMIVFVPIITCVILFQYFKKVDYHKKILLSGSLLVILILTGFVYVFLLQGLSSKSRALDLAIWRDINVTADSNLYRGLARNSATSLFSFNQDPESLSNKIVYNYPISIINVFYRNYLSFFSPDSLFLKGDPILRHSTGQVGFFLPFLAPFMIYGIFVFFNKSQPKAKKIFLIWIIISPLPAAITKDGFGYLLRVITMMPLLSYFSALGIFALIKRPAQKINRLILIIGIFLIGLFSIYYYLYGYFHIYPSLSSKSYEFGFKEISDFQIHQNNKKFLIIWDGYYPYGHFLFWQQTPLSEYQKFNSENTKINNSIFYQTLPNLFFSLPENEKDLTKYMAEKQINYLALPSIFSDRYQEYIYGKNIVTTINYPNGEIAFQIYKIK